MPDYTHMARKFLPHRAWDQLRAIRRALHKVSVYSQTGEDLILSYLFRVHEGRPPGFFVDVGAFHPKKYSNTYYFYQRQWRGINIDPRPGSMAEFNRIRPRDINLEIGIAPVPETLDYLMFNEAAYNGFSTPDLETRDGKGSIRLLGRQRVMTRPLREVLAEYLPQGTAIDFLSVDVEGHDFDVIKSNDWERFRPLVVVYEDTNTCALEQLMETGIASYLRERGYALMCRSPLSVFMARQELMESNHTGCHVRLPNA